MRIAKKLAQSGRSALPQGFAAAVADESDDDADTRSLNPAERLMLLLLSTRGIRATGTQDDPMLPSRLRRFPELTDKDIQAVWRLTPQTPQHVAQESS